MNLLLELFRYNTWATLKLIDTLSQQPPGVVQEIVVGTDRSILHTLTHLVGSEQSYLERVAGETFAPPVRRGEILSLPELRSRCAALSDNWEGALARIDQVDITLPAEEDYPSTPHAQNVLVVQAIQHGIDHRTQICTTLTTLGVQAPELDVWAYWRVAHLAGA